MKHSFASDNYSGVHPDIMEALQQVNHGHAGSYGSDEYTANAIQKFREHFGEHIEVFFAYNGTAANVLINCARKVYRQSTDHDTYHRRENLSRRY
jgi:threonine aldolase